MAYCFSSEQIHISREIFGLNSSNYFYNFTISYIWGTYVMPVDFLTFVFVVPTNSFVIWLIVTGKGSGLATEFSSLNLSVCEILVCLDSLLIFSTSRILSLFFFPHLFAAVYSGQALPLTGRPLFQSLICFERYLAVVHPLTFLKFKPLRYRVICCAFAWTVIFASCWVVYLILSRSFFEYLIFTFAQFLFFLSIMLFCCVAVLRALKQSGPGDRNREKQEENHMKRRAFKIILIITVTMFLIYAPNIISSLLFLCSVEDSLLVLHITPFTNSLGGLVQPFLFLHRVGKLPCTKCC